MNARHWRVALCGLAMALAGTLGLGWWGLSLGTAVAIAIAIACAVSALYAWWLSRRTPHALDAAGKSNHMETTRTP